MKKTFCVLSIICTALLAAQAILAVICVKMRKNFDEVINETDFDFDFDFE